MGQYLVSGIVTESVISKEKLTKYKISTEDLIKEMKYQLLFENDLYNLEENDEYIIFKLKNDIIERELLNFLEVYYPIYYYKNNVYKEALEKIKKTNSQDWIKLAENKSMEAFQIDSYGEEDYLSFDIDFRPTITVSHTTIMLTIEGKIFMEEYGSHFRLAKYCIKQAFKEFKISGAIRVYISG